MTEEMKQFIKMMKDPDVKKALKGDVDLTELIKPIEITEDDTIETVVAKQNKQLTALAEAFTSKLAETENKVTETAAEDRRKAEAETVTKFTAANPGMKDPKVIATMQPLYDKGMSLEDAYAKACKAEDIDPITGVAPVAGDENDPKKKEANDKKATPKKVTSNKSTLADDLDEDDPDDEGKDKGPLSLADTIAARGAEYMAKHGDPFETKT